MAPVLAHPLPLPLLPIHPHISKLLPGKSLSDSLSLFYVDYGLVFLKIDSLYKGMLFGRRIARSMATIPSWATVDPFTLNKSKPHTVVNILDGECIVGQG